MSQISHWFSAFIDWFVAIPILPWVLFPEETAVSVWADHPWHILILILIGIDLCVAGFEYLIIWLAWRKSNTVKNIQTPDWLRRLAKGNEVTYPDLYIFGLTPYCRKFGMIGVFARRHELGFKGFIALELGSFCRLLVYPLLGKYLFLMVGLFLIMRIWEWQKRNGYLSRARKRFRL